MSGGLPNHRVEEHLIVVKAIIGRSEQVRDGGVIVELVDIEKFFDSENLRGIMNTLYSAKVPQKAYRVWYELNSKTEINVKTPAGLSDSKEA